MCKKEKTSGHHVLCDLHIICVHLVGGRIYIYNIPLVSEDIPSSTNYNKAHSNQKEIKTKREQLPSNI